MFLFRFPIKLMLMKRDHAMNQSLNIAKLNSIGLYKNSSQHSHGMQRRMVLVDNFFDFFKLLFVALLLIYAT